MTATLDRLGLPLRTVVAVAFSAIAGVVIGLVDSSPTWDDTGVTVMALLLASGVAAAIAGRRPWLIALVVGGFVPLIEIPRGAGGAVVLAALLFAGVGAGVGYTLDRVIEAGS